MPGFKARLKESEVSELVAYIRALAKSDHRRVFFEYAAAPFVRCTQCATDGTLYWSTMNSRYQPGGARFASAGALAWSTPLPALYVRPTRRCSMSKACVTAPARISSTLRTAAG